MKTNVELWAVGIVGVWLILTFAADVGGLEELAATFAILILLGVVMVHGGTAIQNLQGASAISTFSPTQSGSQGAGQ